jgi:microcystin-dependent protein
MMNPYLGEIALCSFDFPPKGWAFCDGTLLNIDNSTKALFSLIGNRYGGDGIKTFALPDLRGRIPFGAGKTISVGQSGGEEKHHLTISEMPRHTHSVYGGQGAADQPSPANNYWAGNTGMSPFSDTYDTTLAKGAISEWGSDQAHENMPPFQALNFVIALRGEFPSDN